MSVAERLRQDALVVRSKSGHNEITSTWRGEPVLGTFSESLYRGLGRD